MTKQLFNKKISNTIYKSVKKGGNTTSKTLSFVGNELGTLKDSMGNHYRKNSFIWNIIFAIVFIIAYLILIHDKPIFKFTDLLVNPLYLIKPKIETMEMKRPFLNIYDDKGERTNVVFITHPFTRDECIVQYKEAKKKGNLFLGMSSYCEFPSVVSNPHDVLHDPTIDAWAKYNYYELTEGWCHCFREPGQHITDPLTRKALISESDFAPFETHKPDPSVEKEYDFMYVCLKDNDKCEDGWQSYNRNWEVAQKCLDVMCKKYKLKG